MSQSATPNLSPVQEDVLGQLLLDYAVWYETNRERLELDEALGAMVPEETPIDQRVEILYGTATL